MTFAGSAVSSHTELGADCKRTPCSSAVVVLRLCAGYTQHLLPWHCFPVPVPSLYFLFHLLGRSFRAFLSTPGQFLPLIFCGFVRGFIFKTCHWERQQVIRGARLFLGAQCQDGSQLLAANTCRAQSSLCAQGCTTPGAGSQAQAGNRAQQEHSGQREGLGDAGRLQWAPGCQGRGAAETGMELGKSGCGTWCCGLAELLAWVGLDDLEGLFQTSHSVNSVISGSFSGFYSYQPMAFEGKYSNQ